MERKAKRYLVGVTFSVLVFAGFTAFVLAQQFFLGLNDGPYHGNPTECPEIEAHQVFPVNRKLTLEVYAREDTTRSTIVSLIRTGAALWCIEVDEPTNRLVENIEFKEVRGFPFLRKKVVGMADWTDGEQGMYWILRRNGRLKEYWYSW